MMTKACQKQFLMFIMKRLILRNIEKITGLPKVRDLQIWVYHIPTLEKATIKQCTITGLPLDRPI